MLCKRVRTNEQDIDFCESKNINSMKVLENNLENHQADKGKTKSGRKLKTKNIQ